MTKGYCIDGVQVQLVDDCYLRLILLVMILILTFFFDGKKLSETEGQGENVLKGSNNIQFMKQARKDAKRLIVKRLLSA